MAKKKFDAQSKNKKALGQLIVKCRGNMSQRQLAKAIGIPPSNMTYIENGINAPTSEIYAKMVGALELSIEDHRRMDYLYSLIRKTPPPDVCNIVLNHDGLGETLKLLAGKSLSIQDMKRIEHLFSSF